MSECISELGLTLHLDANALVMFLTHINTHNL